MNALNLIIIIRLIQNKVMRQIDAKPLYTCNLQRPDFWRYQIGLNVISADTKNKVTNI
jgi:hypothetical protein